MKTSQVGKTRVFQLVLKEPDTIFYVNCVDNMIYKEFKPVLTKQDFVRRYYNNEFGNRSPTWQTFKEYKESDYRGLVHLRNRNAASSSYYNLNPKQAAKQWSVIDPKQFYISAMAPHDKGVIQGEIKRETVGLYLEYNTQKLPMREGFEIERQHASMVTAQQLLVNAMDPNSWEWLNVLLQRYLDHVVEFSTFSEPWGTIPGYNTVFWEVRKY
jgi:hypothetical protein